MAQVDSGLLERSHELEALTSEVDQARGGTGRLVLVEGAAGIGKTRLLDEYAARVATAGLAVRSVCGDELVMDSSFAAVRELFYRDFAAGREDLSVGAAELAAPVFEGRVGDGDAGDRVAGVLHGLYWFVANLAEHRPLALLIDDAHWLDAPSARFVTYLARRVSSVPVLLVVAARSGGRAGQPGPESVLAPAAAVALRLKPLSEDAAASVVRQGLGARVDEDLCRSCYQATGGNPFYLRELTAALKAEGGRPTVDLARRVRQLGAGSIGRGVLVRLAALGPDCQQLAEGLAVLADGSPLRHAAALAKLDRGRAEVAADRLRAGDLLAPETALRFVHPIVREAVAAELSPSARAALHARAARLLLAEEANTDRVAAHLLSAEPYGDAAAVDALRGAARKAVTQGAPEAAVSYLRRALAEPPPADVRLEVLVELGRTEALLPEAHDHAALREALTLAVDPQRRAEIAVDLITALLGTPDNLAARAAAEEVLEQSDDLDAQMTEHLEGHLIGSGGPDLTAAPRILRRVDRHLQRARAGEVRDPVMLAALAMVGAVAGRPAAEVTRLAERATGDENLMASSRPASGAAAALSWVDRFDSAVAALDAGLAKAQALGNAPTFVGLSVFRGAAAFRSGDLGEAEAHSRRGFELGHDLGFDLYALMWLPGILLERGAADEASGLVEQFELPPPMLDVWHGVVFLAQRGRVRVALGERDRGLDDLLDADRRMSTAGYQLSVLIDWVPAATRALTQLGRREEARELAARELRDAIAFGAPRRHGIALSTIGSLDGGARGVGRLREAVAILASSGARLEHGRALVDLGTALRTYSDDESARVPLAAGLDLAHRCDARMLAAQARAELVAAGARPRREAFTGRDSLTPAELRTARMAAGGMTNREIAQALFLSIKTVEWQLSHAYAKLSVSGRGELEDALRGAPAN